MSNDSTITELVGLVHKLGFVPYNDSGGWRETSSSGEIICEWFIGDVSIKKKGVRLFLDTTGNKWVLSYDPPQYLTEDCIYYSFYPNVLGLIDALTQVAFDLGVKKQQRSTRKALGL